MKKHPKQIANYSILKEKLSKKYPHDIENYVLGKAAFIKSIDVRAAYEETTPPILHKTPRRKSIWSEKEILHAMHANIHLQMSCFAKYLTTMELLFEPDATVVQSTVLDDTYNFVLNARFNEKNAKNRTRHILSLFASKKLPLSWWVGPLDRPDHLEEILLQEGLTFKEENIGMALYLNNKALPSSSTTIERVETKEQLMNFCDVITELGIPKECASEIYQKIPPFLYEQESSFEIHLRRENGKAVSTGILVLHANVAGIYYIITALKERKKGFGTDMMYHLLHRAKKRGYTLATLQASAMGKELYKKIGFQPLCSYKEYSNFYSD